MRSIVRLVVALAATASLMLGVTEPAGAAHPYQTSTVVVFTAGAWTGGGAGCAGLQPTLFWPPGPTPSPNHPWAFDTACPGLQGLTFCQAAHIHVSTAPPGAQGWVGPCKLQANGVLNAGLLGLGPWCGWPRGNGTVTLATVTPLNPGAPPGSHDMTEGHGVNVEWLQSAGTVLPLVFRDKPTGAAAGGGVVQATGTAPGTCGIPAGFGSNRFAVTGTASFRG